MSDLAFGSFSYPLLSEHFETTPSPVSKHLTRAIHSIYIERFARDIISSRLIAHPPSNISDLVDCYNSTLTNLLDKHAPLVSKIIRSKPSQPWFTPALNKLESAKRRLERAWSKSHSSDDLKLLRSATNHYHAAVIKDKMRDILKFLLAFMTVA